MARYEHLPIFRKMMELTLFMEEVVRRFPRYHKFTLGAELRTLCHDCLALIVEANSTRERRPLLLELRMKLERIKVHLVIAKEAQAFPRARSFFKATELVVAVSRQNEGWLKSLGGARP